MKSKSNRIIMIIIPLFRNLSLELCIDEIYQGYQNIISAIFFLHIYYSGFTLLYVRQHKKNAHIHERHETFFKRVKYERKKSRSEMKLKNIDDDYYCQVMNYNFLLPSFIKETSMYENIPHISPNQSMRNHHLSLSIYIFLVQPFAINIECLLEPIEALLMPLLSN